MNFTMRSDNEQLVLEDQDGLYFTAVQLGEDQVYGVAVPATFSFVRHTDEFRGSGAISKDSGAIELLSADTDDHYSRFVSRTLRLTRKTLHILGGLGAEPAVELKTVTSAANNSE